MISRRFIQSGVVMSVLLSLGGVALADPATVTSFSWTVTGQTTAAASGSCPPTDPPGNCPPTSSCSAGPVPTFSESGSTLENSFQSSPAAQYGCSFSCGCCVGGAGGGGQANASILISATSSAESTQWNFGAMTSTLAAVASGPFCGEGSANAGGAAQQTWQLAFQANEAVRLTFVRNHQLALLGDGNAATSTMTLSGSASTLFARTIQQMAEGSSDDDGQVTLFLDAGPYSLTMTSQLDSIAAAPPGGGGSAQSWLRCTLLLTPFDCVQVTGQPGDQSLCSGVTAAFSIDAVGTGVSYRWRLDETDLFDGPTGSGSVLSGTTGPMLTIANVSPADDGSYDCVASNECVSRTSDAATLAVFDGSTGDGNGDGSADGLDIQGLVNILVSGGTPSAGYCPYDMNADGVVDGADVPLFISLLLI